jgi:orotate phosphoribosyltransferase
MSLGADRIREALASAGSLLEGHFVLSSGLHSPAYVQCARLFEHPGPAGELCAELARRCDARRPQAVLGPAYGGILLAYELARHLAARALFVERVDGAFALRRGFRLEPGEPVLIAEDVVTTGGSAAEAAEVARAHGALVVGTACLVDRSRVPVPDLIALLKLDIPTFPAADCPLCAEGRPVEKPGSRKAAAP